MVQKIIVRYRIGSIQSPKPKGLEIWKRDFVVPFDKTIPKMPISKRMLPKPR